MFSIRKSESQAMVGLFLFFVSFLVFFVCVCVNLTIESEMNQALSLQNWGLPHPL